MTASDARELALWNQLSKVTRNLIENMCKYGMRSVIVPSINPIEREALEQLGYGINTNNDFSDVICW